MESRTVQIIRSTINSIVAKYKREILAELSEEEMPKLAYQRMESFFNQLLLSLEKKESPFYYQALSLELIMLNKNEYAKSSNSDCELSFNKYKLAIVKEIFGSLKKSFNDNLEKFPTEKSPLLFLAFNTEKEIISFLENRLSEKKTSSTKLQFLEGVKKTIETEVSVIFEEEAIDYVSLYKWDDDEDKAELFQISHSSVINWITGRQQEFTKLRVNNESKVKKALNVVEKQAGLLPLRGFNDRKKPYDSILMLNGNFLKANLAKISKTELFVAILAWLRNHQYIIAESTEFVEWLDFIGITQCAKLRKRNLWNKVINEYWVRDILERNDLDLHAIFAVKAA